MLRDHLRAFKLHRLPTSIIIYLVQWQFMLVALAFFPDILLKTQIFKFDQRNATRFRLLFEFLREGIPNSNWTVYLVENDRLWFESYELLSLA